MKKESVNIFWFRRDLRLFDNAGLTAALKSKNPVIPVFIFDKSILDRLEEKKDARVQFIHQELVHIKTHLQKMGSDIDIRYGKPLDVWKDLIEDYSIEKVFTNRDYEPYSRDRDEKIQGLLSDQSIAWNDFKDQVIFDRDEVIKDNGEPYVVFTPFGKKWRERVSEKDLKSFETDKYHKNFHSFKANAIPSLEILGFKAFDFVYPDRKVDIKLVSDYGTNRDFPARKGTSQLSLHLRFGTVSIRELTRIAVEVSPVWLNELIWRNFYQIIIWHFPNRIENAFKPKYDRIPWSDDEKAFKAWCEGMTGYPIVDAGMRQLNSTGFMHNRLRMVTASFLTKHLLIDWRWGEAYFAQKLLDFELASNNGGWQWAAGSGCDAAPYFRVFSPELQTKKFDPKLEFIRKWVPELDSKEYPAPIVEHKAARIRAIETYKMALNQ